MAHNRMIHIAHSIIYMHLKYTELGFELKMLSRLMGLLETLTLGCTHATEMII